ncbi:MAG: YiiD C-terminal domain-containing protein [Coxiellaceae bacterium]|nr:YiiD C-terminal domain-containing protein [Coxiellaceae bacterium]
MQKFMRLLKQAQTSKFKLWLLNRVALRMIPFNNQHGFIIKKITDESLETYAPYQRRNFNHLKGIHACGLATIGELSAGMLLLSIFDPTKYRVIMSHLEIDYHYQAKMPTRSIAEMKQPEQQELLGKLDSGEAILKKMESNLYDDDNNHVATAHTTWQLKPWSKVKTKV